MKITVKLFARFKEAAGTGSLSIDMPAGSTLANLLDSLRAQVAGLPLVAGQTILSVNQEFATPETVLHPGDEVAIFPPVSGGGNDAGKFVVTTNPITLDAVARMVTYPHTGAVATFAGVVRNISGDKLVTSLNYEAYHDMAVAKMKQVAQEARRRWPAIAGIAIVQRIGHLEVGELAVAIAVSSGHRNDGCFEACQYSINRLKQIVPIWKKELGPGGEEWIEGDYNPSMQ